MALKGRPQKPLPSLNLPRPSTPPVTRHLPPVRRSSRRMMQLRRSSWASGACRAARTSSPCQLSSWPAPSLPNMILYIHASYSDRLSGITQPPSDVYTTWLRLVVCARISQHVGLGPAVVPQLPPPTVMARKARQSMPLPMTQKTPPIRFAVRVHVVNS